MAQVRTAVEELDDAEERLASIREAVRRTPSAPVDVLEEARSLQARVDALRRSLEGDDSVARRQFETPPSISERVGRVMWSSYGSTSAPGGQQREQLRLAEEALVDLAPRLDRVVEAVDALASRLEALGVYVGG